LGRFRCPGKKKHCQRGAVPVDGETEVTEPNGETDTNGSTSTNGETSGISWISPRVFLLVSFVLVGILVAI